MTHTPHTLVEEFPASVAQISQLKSEDAHFARLAQDYHEVNRNIHRVETNIEPMSDLEMLDLRKRRMWLKDQIAAYLREGVDV